MGLEKAGVPNKIFFFLNSASLIKAQIFKTMFWCLPNQTDNISDGIRFFWFFDQKKQKLYHTDVVFLSFRARYMQ